MNSIAGLLQTVQTRSASDSSGSRSNSEAGVNSGNNSGDGFDTILSGVSQNGSFDPAAPPVPSTLRRLPGDGGNNGNRAVATAGTQNGAEAAAATDTGAQTKHDLPRLAGSPLPNAAAGNAANPGATQSPASALAKDAAPAAKLPGGSVAAQNSEAATSALLDFAAQGAVAAQAEQASVASSLATAAQTNESGAATPAKKTIAGAAKDIAAATGKYAQQNLSSPAAGASPSTHTSGASSPVAASGASSPVATSAGNASATAWVAMVAAQAGRAAASIVDAAGSKSTASAASAPAARDAAKTNVVSTSAAADPTVLAAMTAMFAPNHSVGAGSNVTAGASKGAPAGRSGAAINGSPLEQGPAVSQALAPVSTQAVAAAASLKSNAAAAEFAPQTIAVANTKSNAGEPAPVKVAVLSSATHFAPVTRLSPVQQIANAVVGAMPTLLPGASAAMAGGAANAAQVSAAPASSFVVAQPAASVVKTMNLQLDPGSLGVVTVTLSLSANGLNVQMAASQVATMNMIERDKQSLSNQLGQSGYAVAGLSVALGAHSGANLANSGSSTQGQGGQGPASGGGQAMSQGGSSNGNNGAQHSGQNFAERSGAGQNISGASSNGAAGAAVRGPVSDDLYI